MKTSTNVTKEKKSEKNTEEEKLTNEIANLVNRKAENRNPGDCAALIWFLFKAQHSNEVIYLTLGDPGGISGSRLLFMAIEFLWLYTG